MTTAKYVYDGFCQHTRRRIQSDEDVFATHIESGQVLAVAFAFNFNDCPCFLLTLKFLQASHVIFAGIDIGLKLLYIVDARLCQRFQRVQFSLLALSVFEHCQTPPPFIVDSFQRILEVLLDRRQVAFSYIDFVIKTPSFGQEIFFDPLDVSLGLVIDDEKNKDDGAKAARHNVEKRE